MNDLVRKYRENKIKRRQTTFGFDDEKKISIDLSKIVLFSFDKPKDVYLRPFLSSLSLIKFLKQHSIYFGQKHVET